MNIDELATALLDRHRADMDAVAWQIADGALQAGEFEVAAICVVEDAPVSGEEIDELERLSVEFDDVDRQVAEQVIAKRRKELAPTT